DVPILDSTRPAVRFSRSRWTGTSYAGKGRQTRRVRGERRSAKRGEPQGFEYGCALWRYRQGSSGFFRAGGCGRVGFRAEAEQALAVFQGGLGGVRRQHSFQTIVGFFQQLLGAAVALLSIFHLRPHYGDLLRKLFHAL